MHWWAPHLTGQGDQHKLTPQLGELGAVIASVLGLVPDGVVVFLPSYAFLERVKTVWTASGVLDRLAAKKQVRWSMLRPIRPVSLKGAAVLRAPDFERCRVHP